CSARAGGVTTSSTTRRITCCWPEVSDRRVVSFLTQKRVRKRAAGMPDFVTKAKQRADGADDRFSFKVDDTEVTSLRPTEGQLALLMTAYSSDVRDESTRVAGMIDGSL